MILFFRIKKSAFHKFELPNDTRMHILSPFFERFGSNLQTFHIPKQNTVYDTTSNVVLELSVVKLVCLLYAFLLCRNLADV